MPDLSFNLPNDPVQVLRICGMENFAPRADCLEAVRRWVQ